VLCRAVSVLVYCYVAQQQSVAMRPAVFVLHVAGRRFERLNATGLTHLETGLDSSTHENGDVVVGSN
jgi:hypothetical protein